MAAITLWLAVQAGVSLYFMGMDIYERVRNWLHWRRSR